METLVNNEHEPYDINGGCLIKAEWKERAERDEPVTNKSIETDTHTDTHTLGCGMM